MSLLTITQRAADRIGIPRPNAVYSATDPTVRTLLECANEEGRQMARVHDWQALRRESTFASVASETQTAMVPTDLLRFVDETFWNRSAKRCFSGPVTSQEWQAIKGGLSSSPVTHTFTVRGNAILISPTPSAGQTFAFEYIRDGWCTDSTGVTYRNAWGADADLPVLPEELHILGLTWRFKQKRGLDWAADYTIYENEIRQHMRNERPKRVLDMSMSGPPRTPGVSVPDGSWLP